MKIVIDIPDKDYIRVCNMVKADKRYSENTTIGTTYRSILHGTVLPEGYGDLIDRNILLQNWKVIPSRDRLIFDRYIQALNAVIPADK